MEHSTAGNPSRLSTRVRTALRDPRRAASSILRRLSPDHEASGDDSASQSAGVHVRDAEAPSTVRPGLSLLLTVRHDHLGHVAHRVAAAREAVRVLGGELDVVLSPYDAPGASWPSVLPTAPGGLSWAASRPGADWSSAYALGLPRVSCARCLVLDAGIEVDGGVLAELVRRHDGGVTTAVVLGPDDVVVSAGAVRAHASLAPSRLLQGHPGEDAEILGRHQVFGAAEPVFVSDVELLGPPPVTADEMLAVVAVTTSAAARDGGVVVVEPVGRVRRLTGPATPALDEPAGDLLASWADRPADVSALEAAGFDVVGVTAERVPVRHLVRPAIPLLAGGRIDPRVEVHESVPRLRWSLRIAAHPGPRGDDWGDVFFADDLAAALRRLGQRVHVDRRQAHGRPLSEHLDDVSVVLRGLDVTAPSAARHNVLWVISHPELVRPRELALYPRRYSAGASWAEETTRSTGLLVQPLLQATDPRRFTPEGPRVPSRALFIGKTRRVLRPVVADAVAAGVDLTLYGEGWEDFVAPERIAGEFVANDELPAHYRGAHVVLNDHWDDMRRFGLFSNRLFDAVSAGARVISDDVPGLAAVFGPSVQTYRDQADLRRLVTDPTAWAGDEVIAANARRVGREHSFDARARRLLDDVLSDRS